MISKKRSVNFNLKEAHRIGFLIKKNKTELFVDFVYEYTNNAFLKEVRIFKIEELFLNTVKLEEFVSIFKKYFIFKNSSLKENEYFNNLFIKDRIINSEFLIQNRNDILNKIKPMLGSQIKTKEIIGETVFNRLEDLYIDKYMLNYCEKYNIDINLSFKEKEELILNNLKNDISLIGYKSGIDNDTNFLTQEEIDALLDIVGIEED